MAKGKEGRSFATFLELRAFTPEEKEYEVGRPRFSAGRITSPSRSSPR